MAAAGVGECGPVIATHPVPCIALDAPASRCGCPSSPNLTTEPGVAGVAAEFIKRHFVFSERMGHTHLAVAETPQGR